MNLFFYDVCPDFPQAVLGNSEPYNFATLVRERLKLKHSFPKYTPWNTSLISVEVMSGNTRYFKLGDLREV